MFEKNLMFIDNEELKTKLKKISVTEASRGITYCITPSEDYILLKNEVPIDDLNNPREAARTMLHETIKNPMGKHDIIIVFGLGLGYLLDEAFNAYPSKIYVYEPDINILNFVLHNVDISEHLSSGRVYITNSISQLEKKLSNTYITKDKLEIVYLKNYAVVRNKELLELTQKVFDTCKSKIVDINTITKFSKIWLINTLKNIGLINNKNAYKLSDLENKFIGQTALILAAGPSLTDNLEKIKNNRDKYVIFAVNKALRVLAANGIVPDFAVCLDAAYVVQTLTGLEELCKQTNCIMDLKSDCRILEQQFNKIFVSFSQNDFVIKSLSNFNKGIEIYECGGSATTLAFVAAVKMGFGKIIFSGLDLALRDNVIYSTGEEVTQLSGNQISIGSTTKKLTQVKSVTGDMVNTRDDYAAFIKHFEALIKDFNYSEVYNTTPFGAYIEGVKNVLFENLSFASPVPLISTILNGCEILKFDIPNWSQDELHKINDIINLLSKGNFSPALVSAIVKSPLMYQYMQADILQVVQSNFDTAYAEEFMQKAKVNIKEIVDLLQKNRLI